MTLQTLWWNRSIFRGSGISTWGTTALAPTARSVCGNISVSEWPCEQPIMPSLLSFLDELKQNPDDDALRLIFADWLMEQGDPRGEFIRLQVECARLPLDDPRLAILEQREIELRETHRHAWFGPLVTGAAEWSCRRGLIRLHCKAEELLSRAWAPWVESEAFAWVEYLHLRQHGGWLGVTLRELADLPALAHLATFQLGDNHLRATD